MEPLGLEISVFPYCDLKRTIHDPMGCADPMRYAFREITAGLIDGTWRLEIFLAPVRDRPKFVAPPPAPLYCKIPRV